MAHLPPPVRIQHDEFITRMTAFFIKFPDEHRSIGPYDVTEMFLLYNDRLVPRETGKSCSGCRSRVYRRLKAHWTELNTPTNEG